jgi:hypothetical protein
MCGLNAATKEERKISITPAHSGFNSDRLQEKMERWTFLLRFQLIKKVQFSIVKVVGSGARVERTLETMMDSLFGP